MKSSLPGAGLSAAIPSPCPAASATSPAARGCAAAEVHSAAADVGQGVHTVLAQIARTEMGVEHVVLHPSDTRIGSAGSSSASAQTARSGGVVHLACRAVRDELFARVRAWAHVEGRTLHGDLALAGGMVLAGGEPLAPIARFLDEPIARTRTYHHRRTQPMDAQGQGDVHVTFAFAAMRAVVEVDEELGLVRVVQVATAQDVGRALNPSFTDYLIPTILDMPPVEAVLVEEPDPETVYGAKGVGEPPTVVATAATRDQRRAAALHRGALDRVRLSQAQRGLFRLATGLAPEALPASAPGRRAPEARPL